MSYRFCFGASGAGKSYVLHNEVIEKAGSSLDRRALYIVPEQFTMQTQKDLVMASPGRGIMNVDVLSFGRLAHRIFEETGSSAGAALDDIGKSLILRRVAGSVRNELKVLGGQIGRPGLIEEVKSVISELMQYGIGPDDMDRLIRYAGAGGQGALEARLSDIQVLYRAFGEYKKDRFITGEERLDLLAEALEESEYVRGSIVVFDGFTGFTPSEYRVIASLMRHAREVIFSVTISEDGGPDIAGTQDPKVPISEQDLFYLSRKTVRDIMKLAEESGTEHGRDILCGKTGLYRFADNPAMDHLEKALFRYPVKRFGKDPEDAVELTAADTPVQEIREAFRRIRDLTFREGYAYRDIGIVLADPDSYRDEIQRQAVLYGIPVYIDSTRSVLQNPLTESIRSALDIVISGFSYDSVFRYLRSGLSDITMEETDLLENYCRAHGIRSRKKWQDPFEEEAEPLRRRFLSEIEPLLLMGRQTAEARSRALYAYLTGVRAQEKIAGYAAYFAEKQDAVREKEYDQIYREVIDLLDRICLLIGDEMISQEDYLELVETGFSEIRLGTLPQKVDRILVGDMERTRLSQLQILFFLGVNDGNIPRTTSRGGLISDPEREFLSGSGEELAPTPRQEMYIQRFYLYMNMTKPARKLIVSWSGVSFDGRSIRPSYLIEMLTRMFPFIRIRKAAEESAGEQIGTCRDAEEFLAGALRRYADGLLDGKDEETAPLRKDFLTVYGYCTGHEEELRQRILSLTEAAFIRFHPRRLSAAASEKLYGRILQGSVTRLENAAQCYRKQFLQYGLHLKERDDFVFEAVDAGTVLHESIRIFSRQLKEDGISWNDFSPEDGRRIAAAALQRAAAQYNGQVMYATARSARGIERMERVLERTVDTLQFQLRAGSFVPAEFEMGFGKEDGLSFDLPDGRKLILEGRIDRIDVAEEDGQLFLKILDYKSGLKDLDPKQMKNGLQLQLLLYMEAALARAERKNPGKTAVPAALLYYHFGDPLTNSKGIISKDITDENVMQSLLESQTQEVRKLLRPKGMVSGEKEALELLDRNLSGTSSMVVPVSLKKDGTISDRGSKVFTRETYREMAQALKETVCRLAEEILDGNIAAEPVVLQQGRTACTFCSYKDVCGFDPKIPGTAYREMTD